MKKKLKTIFLLIVVSLAGIIVFQTYWTFNAYKVNKEKFDSNINNAMRLAMDDCKKDYFDSIRVIMVKKLSAPDIRILIDTLPENPYGFEEKYNFLFVKGNIRAIFTGPDFPSRVGSNFQPTAAYLKKLYAKLKVVQTGMKPPAAPGVNKKNLPFFALPEGMKLSSVWADHQPYVALPFTIQPYAINKGFLDYYRSKIPHKATLPEVLVEMAFDKPELMEYFNFLFGEDDSNLNWITKYFINDKNKRDSMMISVSDKRDNYFRLSDSARLTHHLNQELAKANIRADFKLIFSLNPIAQQKPDMRYSETKRYIYQYHGLVPLRWAGPEFSTKAIFGNPQYAVLKSMMITLIFSVLLIALTIYCFLYITRTILEQKKLAELKDDFINNMTHELKTPIATITVAIEGMQKFNALNDPEKTKRYLQTSKEELTRLNELVSKVLNVAAFENKEIVLVKEHIKVDELLNEVIDAERSKAGKTANISYSNPYNIKTIVADRFHFRNVLVNLIDNAIKYSDEPADIAITCYKEGNNVAFSIKDKGIGIPPEHINQIFNKFHRVPTGNIHNVKGTGLGLSYVKYIAEAHGGSVTAKSEINKGSEFIVTIPLANG